MSWNASFPKKLNIKCREFQFKLTNDCVGNQLNYDNDLSAIGNKNYALQKPFETDFLTVISNAKLRSSFVIC